MKDLQVATQLGEEIVLFWAQPQRVDPGPPHAGALAFALLERIVLGYHSFLAFLLDASP